MENGEKLYGRKRVKKIRPGLGGKSSSAGDGGKNKKVEISPENKSENPENGLKTAKSSESLPTEKRERAKAARPSSHGNDRSSSRNKPYKSKSFSDNKRDKSNSRNKSGASKARTPNRTGASVSVIIPAYNEEDNIKPLTEMFDKVIKGSGKNWEVVLVNDGSTDKTLNRSKEASSKYRWLKVVSYPINRGLTSALNAGFKAARGSILVFYPADLQYHPQDIPKMVYKIEQGADLVAGWKQGKYNKKLVSYVYNKLCRLLFGLKIHDMNSVKAFKRNVVKNLSFRRDWHRYMVVMAAEEGFVIDETKVKLYPRKFGKSKFGFGRILGGVLDLFSVKFQITFMKKPLRFFGLWGFIVGGLGFVAGLIALYLRFFTSYGTRALLFPTILLVLAGLMLFAIGFLAEVLVGLKEEIESLKSK